MIMDAIIKSVFVVTLLNLMPIQTLGDSVTTYRKTNVILENYNEPSLSSASTRSPMSCLATCGMDVECRTSLFCFDPILDERVCYLYRDGENCIGSTTTIQNKVCLCFTKEIQVKDGTTYCPIGNYGNNCDLTIRECDEGKLRGLKGSVRSYIKPGSYKFEELCDFDNGYTTIQVRRQDVVEVDFNRTWSDYVKGFGLSHSEHWFGLQNIYNLTTGVTSYKLEMVIKRVGYDDCIFTYNNFRLSDTYYNALYSTKSVLCKFGVFPLIDSNNAFSTYDKINANVANCHSPVPGGWWIYNTGSLTDCQGYNLNKLRSELFWNSERLKHITLRLAPM